MNNSDDTRLTLVAMLMVVPFVFLCLLLPVTGYSQTNDDIKKAIETYWIAQRSSATLDLQSEACLEYFTVEEVYVLDTQRDGNTTKIEVALGLIVTKPVYGNSQIVHRCANGGNFGTEQKPIGRILKTEPMILEISKWSSGWRVDKYHGRR